MGPHPVCVHEVTPQERGALTVFALTVFAFHLMSPSNPNKLALAEIVACRRVSYLVLGENM